MNTVGIEQILLDLQDEDREIKRLAAQAMMKRPSSRQMVSEVLKGADRPTVSVIYDVLFDEQSDFVDVFRDATEDGDPRVRAQAIRYLFRRGQFGVEDGLRWIHDEDPFVRRRSVTYLSWITDRCELEPVLDMAVEDDDPRVRLDALRLIAVWGQKSDAGRIIGTLEDRDPHVRMQAIYTLKRITGENFGEPLGASDDELEWIVAKWQGWWELAGEEA